MLTYFLKDFGRNQHDPNPEDDYEGKPFTVNELEVKLLEGTGDVYKLSRSKLRWYHNLGIVERPTRKGRFAIYPFRTFWDMLAIRALLEYFHLTINEIQKLRKMHSNLYSTAMALQKIEQNYKLRSAAPLLFEFTELGNDPRKGPNDGFVSSYDEIKIYRNELAQMPGALVRIEERIIPKIRKEFFALIHKGSHPLHIGIVYED